MQSSVQVVRDGVSVQISWRSLALLLFVSPLTVLLLFFLLKSDAAPAWVQAVGSVVAIGAAIWISQSEARRQADQRRQEEYQYLETVQMISENAVVLMRLIVEDIEIVTRGTTGSVRIDGVTATRNQHLLQTIFADFEAVDPLRLKEPDMAASFIEIRRKVFLSNELIGAKLEMAPRIAVSTLEAWVEGIAAQVIQMGKDLSGIKARSVG